MNNGKPTKFTFLHGSVPLDLYLYFDIKRDVMGSGGFQSPYKKLFFVILVLEYGFEQLYTHLLDGKPWRVSQEKEVALSS